MRILALDTATRAGSWALLEDGLLTADGEGDAAIPHGARLPDALLSLVASRGLTMAAIDLFAVTSGPGSFTGLRVGAATIQGLAFATGRQVVGVPTLDAVAETGVAAPHEPGAPPLDYIAAWLDGQRGEVFAALYALRPVDGRPDAPPDLRLLMPPQAATPSVIIGEIAGVAGHGRVGFAGDGATRYAGVIESLQDVSLRGARVIPPATLAPHVARLAAARAATAGPPHAIVPVYVRRPDVERDKSRSTGPSTLPDSTESTKPTPSVRKP